MGTDCIINRSNCPPGWDETAPHPEETGREESGDPVGVHTTAVQGHARLSRPEIGIPADTLHNPLPGDGPCHHELRYLPAATYRCDDTIKREAH